MKIYHNGHLVQTVVKKQSVDFKPTRRSKLSKNRRGSNQYEMKRKENWKTTMPIGFVILLFIALAGYTFKTLTTPRILYPIPDNAIVKSVKVAKEAAVKKVEAKEVEVSPTPIIKTPEIEDVDILTGQAIDEFYKGPGDRSYMRQLMHCLLFKETKHDYSKDHGDGGLAGGPLQFHQPTWEGYRKIMIEEGYAKEIGSRYDLKEAIRTTVWAIRDGRGNAWGPILRGECN